MNCLIARIRSLALLVGACLTLAGCGAATRSTGTSLESAAGISQGCEPSTGSPSIPPAYCYFAREPTLVASIDLDAAASVFVQMLLLEGDDEWTSLARGTVRDVATEALDQALQGLVGFGLGEFDAHELDRLTVGVWAESDSLIAVMNPEVLHSLPSDGAAPVQLTGSSLYMALRDGNLVVGEGTDYFEGIAEGGYEPTDAWSEGWSVMPDEPALQLVIEDVSALNQVIETDRFRGGATRAAYAVSAGGGVSFALDIADDWRLTDLLGQMQRNSFELPIEAMLPPDLAPVGEYLRLVVRSLWSQVHLDRQGTTTTVVIADPSCGSLNLPAMALLNSATHAVSALQMSVRAQRLADGRSYVNIAPSEDVECGAIGGPSSQPRVQIVLAGSPAPDANALMVSADVSALLRAQLPTFFGLLPSALNVTEVVDALGPVLTALGGVDSSTGQASLYLELGGGGLGDVTGGALMFPETGIPLLEGVFGGEFPGLVQEGQASLISRPEIRDRMTTITETQWTRAMAALPADAALILLIPPSTLSSVVGWRNSACGAALAASEMVIVTADVNLVPSLQFSISGEAEQVAAVCNDEMRGLMRAAVQGMPTPFGDIFEPLVAYLGDTVNWVGATDNVVTLEMGANAGTLAYIATVATLARPHFYAYLERAQQAGQEAQTPPAAVR